MMQNTAKQKFRKYQRQKKRLKNALRKHYSCKFSYIRNASTLKENCSSVHTCHKEDRPTCAAPTKIQESKKAIRKSN